jgi:hypothetical protein
MEHEINSMEYEILRRANRQGLDVANVVATQLQRLNNTPHNTIKEYSRHQNNFKVYIPLIT